MKDWNYDNEQWTKLPAHMKHLPLFTRQIDWVSISFRYAWAFFLKVLAFRFYIRLKVKGDYRPLYEKHPRLILISNHASHLDAVSIAASIPARYWIHLFIAAAKDYFFTNPLFTFFSQHCLGAIPIDRKDKRGEAIRLITQLLTQLDRMWLILFPEGTRSKDGKIHDFKRGVSLFAERTNTPILFVYLEGNSELWPKGAFFAKPGKLVIHVGPVMPPAPIEDIYREYRRWVESIVPGQFDETEIPDWMTRTSVPKPAAAAITPADVTGDAPATGADEDEDVLDQDVELEAGPDLDMDPDASVNMDADIEISERESRGVFDDDEPSSKT
ncbi:MAG: 1-acyl-sn-glycerol-3-phosphate acyltransferase [Bdellovibrionaceae bacterium]|nr:1-acyl-sn-glycerol-3-phosphate acyltransferase [Pseudobdellovibrionaceae bacterium]